MDPYLEHPLLWPDVHNSLIAAIRDMLAPILRPRYFVALESRVYTLKPGDLVLVGRPDLTVVPGEGPHHLSDLPLADAGFVTVLMPIPDEVEETYLEVREIETGKAITVIELLSPSNKLPGQGRDDYEQKRRYVTSSRTNLVEIDLLRSGEPMPVSKPIKSDYRILVARGSGRPQAHLYAFSVRKPIPTFPLPLLPGDVEPLVDINTILHDLYDRAAFDMRVNYSQPPVPPLRVEDAAWANEVIKSASK